MDDIVRASALDRYQVIADEGDLLSRVQRAYFGAELFCIRNSSLPFDINQDQVKRPGGEQPRAVGQRYRRNYLAPLQPEYVVAERENNIAAADVQNAFLALGHGREDIRSARNYEGFGCAICLEAIRARQAVRLSRNLAILTVAGGSQCIKLGG